MSLTSTYIPLNLHKPSEPFAATVTANIPLTPNSSEDVRHISLSVKGSQLKWLEGQSLGVIPPGQDANDKPHRLRLYSIASARTGEDPQELTVAFCVKRVVYQNEAGEEVRGVASNLLCDAQPGDTIRVCGPVGKHFLMPGDAQTPILMIATGTGIAPFRGFIRTRAEQAAVGPAFLVFGVRTSQDLLYADELRAFTARPDHHVQLAISREQTNAQGGRMYVGDRLTELTDTLWPLLTQGGLFVYQCGMKGMEAGVEAAFAAIAQASGNDWPALLKQLRQEKRWLVDTY
jgi:ferredoxin--NADP+ reductase